MSTYCTLNFLMYCIFSDNCLRSNPHTVYQTCCLVDPLKWLKGSCLNGLKCRFSPFLSPGLWDRDLTRSSSTSREGLLSDENAYTVSPIFVLSLSQTHSHTHTHVHPLTQLLSLTHTHGHSLTHTHYFTLSRASNSSRINFRQCGQMANYSLRPFICLPWASACVWERERERV